MREQEKDVDKLHHHVTWCTPTTTRHGLTNSGSQAERETVRFLLENLKEHIVGNYFILVNYNIPMQGADAREVDLVVIDKYGVFLLEVKAWSGNIRAYNNVWEIDEKHKIQNPLESINAKARILHARTFGEGSELNQLKRVSVTGLVVLANGTNSFINVSQRDSEAVVGLNDTLIDILSSTLLLHNRANSRLLDNLDIRRVQNTIYGKHTSRLNNLVSNYRILRSLPEGDLFSAYEAENVNRPSEHVRIKRYHLYNLSLPDAARSIHHFQRSGEALAALGSHTNILSTKNFFPDLERPDVFYEVTELVPGKDRRLDEIMMNAPRSFSQQKQVDYLEQLCQALRHAHTYRTPEGEKWPIYHRNIRPETIFVTNEQIVKLADFDFAKFGHSHTIVVVGKAFVEGDFIAPEVVEHPSYATASSDIYALGVLWYKMASARTHTPKFDPRQGMRQVDELQLPEPMRSLMKRMIARAPVDRPQSVDEVLSALNQLKEIQ